MCVRNLSVPHKNCREKRYNARGRGKLPPNPARRVGSMGCCSKKEKEKKETCGTAKKETEKKETKPKKCCG